MWIWAFQTNTASPRANFLLAFALAFGFLTVALSFRLDRRGRYAAIGLALLLLVGGVGLASASMSGRNSLINLVRNDRFETGAGGLCGLIAALAVTAASVGRPARLAAQLLSLAVVGFATLFLFKDAVRGGSDGAPAAGGARAVGERVRVEEYASLDFTPTCFTRGPDKLLYVGGIRGDINWEGIVVRLVRQSPDGPLVSEVVASHLVRPHGLAFHDGHLYVARTGQYSATEGDRMGYRPTGSVTRLTDVDGDGRFDLYRDVLSGLPGAYGVHQVSGLVFDREGYMYVSVGAPDDHGATVDPYEGKILRARPDGSEVTVFARGVRNPYDLVMGPGEVLLCTDNDADDLNRGDVVYAVREGNHMGFPYNQVHGALPVDGITPPLYLPGNAAVLEGLAYAEAGSLPTGFDDCVYVAELFGNRVARLRLSPKDAPPGLSAEVLEPLASIERPLDLVIAPDESAVYVLRGYDEKKIDRIVIERN